MPENDLSVRARMVQWALTLDAVTLSITGTLWLAGYVVHCYMIWFGG